MFIGPEFRFRVDDLSTPIFFTDNEYGGDNDDGEKNQLKVNDLSVCDCHIVRIC